MDHSKEIAELEVQLIIINILFISILYLFIFGYSE